jgi:hypothetical protein
VAWLRNKPLRGMTAAKAESNKTGLGLLPITDFKQLRESSLNLKRNSMGETGLNGASRSTVVIKGGKFATMGLPSLRKEEEKLHAA